MKLLLLLSLTLFIAAVIAQPFYEVIETPKLLGSNWENSYTINIVGADAAAVEKTWSAMMLGFGGRPEEATAGPIKAFSDVALPAISELPLEIYYAVYEDSEATSTHLTI